LQLFLRKDNGQEDNKILHLITRICLFYIITVMSVIFFGCGTESVTSGSTGTSSASDNNGSVNNGSVTLAWKQPVSDANGSTLNDLAGYKIYYGMSSMNYTRSVDVGHSTDAVISSLSSGRWCFSVTAYDVSGNESKYSNEMCKTI